MATMPTSRPVEADVSRATPLESCTFGLFELDMATGELRRSGRPVHLAPQPTRVLLALVERAGRIVTRDELKQSVWGGDTFVDFEQGLNFCIKEIRAALGDDAESPRFIETVPRRGYRVIAPVERRVAAPLPDVRHQTQSPPATSRRSTRLITSLAVVIAAIAAAGAGYRMWVRDPSPAVLTGKTMIAVLPFENLSGDPNQDFFSEGFTEELIGQLGRTNPARLGVISRTSTGAYRNTTKSAGAIGRELGVQHLVEGTVRRAGDRVRINAQLIRVSDQSHVWAEIYEGDVRDILAIQQEVGNAIVRQIVATLGSQASASPRTVDPAVYDLYLRGRVHWSRRLPLEVEKAAAAFTEAVRRDPTFAPAFASLAYSLNVRSRPAALAAAEKALSLDDRLAEAHSARALALTHMLRWDEAGEAFLRAIALDPSNVPARYFYADYLAARGRCPEAIEQARQGVALDPLAAIPTHALGVTLYYCREYEAALPYFKRALELDAEHYWSNFRIGLVLEQRRSYDAALAEFQRLPGTVRAAYTYALAGRSADARRVVRKALDEADRDLQAYHLGTAYVGLGEHDEALRWLTLAVSNQAYDVIYLDIDPRLDPIRSRPEFQSLLREGGWR